MNEENTDEDVEFDDIVDDKDKTRLDFVEHLDIIPIIPQKSVIYPYEDMKMPVGDAVLKDLCDEIEDGEGLIGMVEAEDGGLPPVGTIGVGADVLKVNRKILGKQRYLVEFHGYIRFRIDEYVDSGKPYAAARVTFFEDDPPNEKEKAMIPQECRKFRKYLREYTAAVGKVKNMDHTVDKFTDKYIYMFSFVFWFCFKPVPQEVRKIIIEQRSATQRLYLLNGQFERFLKRFKKQKPAKWN